MAIPISYTCEILRLRKGLTLMTALGIAPDRGHGRFSCHCRGLDRAFATREIRTL